MNYFFLVLAGILSGGIVFGGKILAMMGASPFEIMFYPNFIGALLVTPFIFKDFRRFISFPLPITLAFLFSVFFVAVGQYAPLFMDISVTLVLLLLYIQPVWTILIERFYFHKEVPASHWFLVAAMVLGLVLLINPFGTVQFSLPGIILALLAGLGLSVWILVTQYFSQQKISPASTFWCTCAYAALPVLFLYFAANDYMAAHHKADFVLTAEMPVKLWVAFAVYIIFIYTPASMLVFFNNKTISAPVIGMILLLEPVTGIALDILFLHTPLTWNLICGGSIILISNAVLILKDKGSSS